MQSPAGRARVPTPIQSAQSSVAHSIMVAKAGWIVERGDRQPEDLLLLAFARPTRDELEQRVK